MTSQTLKSFLSASKETFLSITKNLTSNSSKACFVSGNEASGRLCSLYDTKD